MTGRIDPWEEQGSVDQKLLNSLEWRLVGPHRGGRVVAVAGHPVKREVFYFGACAGGVWKTTSAGALWENISDGYFKTSAVGALTVADADPNVIYAGMGETSIRSNVSHGDGVYRSIDGGHTWQNIGLAETRHIGDILVHPKNPDHVFVAALGHAYGRNEERGVFRTTDGGKHWDKVLYISDKTGVHDIAWDPNNPRILYAAAWETQRHPHALWSGGEQSGIWRSTDGGDTWSEITRNPGMSDDAVLGKIGVAASPARPGRVWAVVEAENGGGLYRSDDYGDTWTLLNGNPDLRRRPWYYMHVFADPVDENTVWVLNVNCWRSHDGGKTFDQIPTPHGDNHGLWIDPQDSNRIIEGNDGGACITYDGGYTWSSILNQPTAQFYHVTADNEMPYNIYGSQQDNWAMRLPSIGFEGAISQKDYMEPGGGESGHIAISRKEPHTVFGGGIGTGLGHGRLIAWNPQTRHARNVTVWPEVFGFGAGADELKYRFQWTFPVEFSPHSDDVLYACSNFVHKSTDEGSSWQVISPDLTRNDPERTKSSGGPITADNSGAEIYCTIFAFRESPLEEGLLWAGSDDGLIHVSRDGGKNWENVTPKDYPEWTRISIIEPSPFDAGTVYIAANNYQQDDLKPYLLRSNDYGKTWKLITNGIPDDEFTRTIRTDPARQGLLYAGTEVGLHVSFDDGDSWSPFQSNLPVTPIHDVIVKGTDLVAATHGRSFWIMDDLSPVHQMKPSTAEESVVLFQPRDTIRYRHYGRAFGATPDITNYKMTGPTTVAYRLEKTAMGTNKEAFLDAGQNPPNGVVIHYWLKEKPEGELKVTILDADGNDVRTYSSTSEDPPKAPAAAGANRLVWDYRYASPTKLIDPPKIDRFGQMMEAGSAPRAVPGQYQVRLTIGDTELTQPFTILEDPRLSVTQQELAEQFDLKLMIRNDISTVHEALNQLTAIKKQVDAWEGLLKDDPSREDVAKVAGEVKEALIEVESELVNLDSDKPQPGSSKLKEKMIALSMMIDESDHAPTAGAVEVQAMLGDQLETVQARLRQVISSDVQKLVKMLESAKIPRIVA
jgi:photosystem II stability/assembly factor-like uncharacterized protein